MRAHSNNPPANAIPGGIAEPDLVTAITTSGYPLQGIVAARLLRDFNIIEEWGFIDDVTQDHRSLDVYAFRPLGHGEEAQLQPGLRLLVECKRSRHPFVFFQQVVHNAVPWFPHVHGVPNGYVSIYQPGAGRQQMIEAWPALAMGLDDTSFVAGGPAVCASFSKAIPNGKKVELSGADAFNTIVLPLVRALQHAVSQAPPPLPTALLYPTLTLCVAVLDAPMLVVESPEKANDPSLSPWVRVVRHESTSGARPASRFYAIDFVHSDYVSAFLAHHLLPFANEFAARATRLEDVLRYGGDVSSLENWTWDQIKPRPKPAR